MATPPRDLSGLRVLVIEDEAMVVMLLEDVLAEIGCEVVGVASRFDDAVEKVRLLAFDIAILDVNLNGRDTTAIADLLAERGIRFLVVTGYGARGLPEALQAAPRLHKPFRERDLVRALQTALI